MTSFTPWSGLIGGALIGLAATLLLWLNGRIAGISGIVGGGLSAPKADTLWRAAFVAGLVLGPAVYWAVAGAPPVVTLQAGWPATLAAGLLVGWGSRLGSGCTSGHGVCGVARLAPRSLVATAVFMTVAALTVFVSHHLIGG